ncbi:MAG: aldo/keto reductase [Candidatus Heimdallarchaeota archaeon]|nr:aldo/keto reductase [Candidatus Heimdallarchaeota archaeon]
MKYVNLGNTGIKVSRICLGMMSYGDPTFSSWILPLPDAEPIVKKALDAGINFFDTADVYSKGKSEEITGKLLNPYRDEVVIASKVFFPIEGYEAAGKPNKSGLSRYHIRRAIKGSLERLNMENIDLYQIHRLDPHTSYQEVLQTLNYLIQEGKISHIGASSMFAWQFMKSLWIADQLGIEPFCSMQNHYNLVYREEEREMIPLCKDQNIAMIPWSPLARGFLSGKYKRGEEITSIRGTSDKYLTSRYFRKEDFQVLNRLIEIAHEKGVFPAQIALAWLFSKDYVTAPILGATKVEYIDQAVEALEIKLSEDDIRRLEEHYVPHPILGHS